MTDRYSPWDEKMTAVPISSIATVMGDNADNATVPDSEPIETAPYSEPSTTMRSSNNQPDSLKEGGNARRANAQTAVEKEWRIFARIRDAIFFTISTSTTPD